MKPIYKNVPLGKVRIDSCGDHMTMEEFIDYCKSGCLINYDGWGNYATKDMVSDKVVRPSDVMDNKHDESFSHVMWYNR